MKEGPDIAHIAALIGDPARANMLTALMSGKALTVSELAEEAGVTIQTASSHLSKLDDGGLLRPRKQGRHKYFVLASDEVAHVLEGLMGLAAGSGYLRKRTGPRDAELRQARVCYNHLAGELGVALYDGLLASAMLEEVDGEPVLTEAGREGMMRFGIDLAALETLRRPLCRSCLDWSARRTHLAGSLGQTLLSRFESLGWAHREAASRVVHFTEGGETELLATFCGQDQDSHRHRVQRIMRDT